jgi:hypothetical protein
MHLLLAACAQLNDEVLHRGAAEARATCTATSTAIGRDVWKWRWRTVTRACRRRVVTTQSA